MGQGLAKSPRDLCQGCGRRRRLKYYMPKEKPGKMNTIGLCRKCDRARKYAAEYREGTTK